MAFRLNLVSLDFISELRALRTLIFALKYHTIHGIHSQEDSKLRQIEEKLIARRTTVLGDVLEFEYCTVKSLPSRQLTYPTLRKEQ